MMMFEVDAQMFVRGMSETVADMGAKGAPVEVKAAGDYPAGTKFYWARLQGDAGFAITPKGELVSLYKGRYALNMGVRITGKGLVLEALELGATHLDCFDGYLTKLYASCGFEEVTRLERDDQYAPDGWGYDALGRPDVVYMALPNA